jgi:hypothetical protein
MATTVLKNGTNNKAKPHSNSTVIGNNLESKGNGQTVYGQFNDTEGDQVNDLVQIGSGNSKERSNALRVDKNGNTTLMGGEIYMDTTVGSIVLRVPIMMEGIGKDSSTTITKKVYL